MTRLDGTNAFRSCFIALAAAAGLASWSQPATAAGGELQDNAVKHFGAAGECVAGGVGIEAQQQLTQYARTHGYNLQLVFALNTGNYVADVDVKVSDRNGHTLVTQTAEGPFFLAKLPSSAYTVSATYRGTTHTRRIQLASGNLRKSYFYWPADPSTDFVVAGARASEGTAAMADAR